MDYLSNSVLIETYQKAISLQLDEHFIKLLRLEIYRRNIQSQLLKEINI